MRRRRRRAGWWERREGRGFEARRIMKAERQRASERLLLSSFKITKNMPH